MLPGLRALTARTPALSRSAGRTAERIDAPATGPSRTRGAYHDGRGLSMSRDGGSLPALQTEPARTDGPSARPPALWNHGGRRALRGRPVLWSSQHRAWFGGEADGLRSHGDRTARRGPSRGADRQARLLREQTGGFTAIMRMLGIRPEAARRRFGRHGDSRARSGLRDAKGALERPSAKTDVRGAASARAGGRDEMTGDLSPPDTCPGPVPRMRVPGGPSSEASAGAPARRNTGPRNRALVRFSRAGFATQATRDR
jgi:hypothetical protein